MNRFVTPIPLDVNFTPYEMPYEEMAGVLAHAQEQQDTMKAGVMEILDTEFNYIPTQSNEEAYHNIKGDLTSKMQNLIGMSQDGDLRGLKGELLNAKMDLKRRLTSKNGDIYRLSSDAETYNSWWESDHMKDIRAKEPQRAEKYRAKYLSDLEESGGSLNSRFNNEMVVETPDFSKLVSDYARNFKANKQSFGNEWIDGYYQMGQSGSLSEVDPLRILEGAAGYLLSDPTYQAYMQQEINHGFLKPEAQDVITYQKSVDNKGNEVTTPVLNPAHPAAGAIVSAVSREAYVEKDERFKKVIDSGLFKFYHEQQSPDIHHQIYGLTQSEGIEDVQKTLDQIIDSGDPAAIKQAINQALTNPNVLATIEALKEDPNAKNLLFNQGTTPGPGILTLGVRIGGRTIDYSKYGVTQDDMLEAFVLTGGTRNIGRINKALRAKGYNIPERTILEKGIDFIGQANQILNVGISNASSRVLNFLGIDANLGRQSLLLNAERKAKSQTSNKMDLVQTFTPIGNTRYEKVVRDVENNFGSSLFIGGQNIPSYAKSQGWKDYTLNYNGPTHADFGEGVVTLNVTLKDGSKEKIVQRVNNGETFTFLDPRLEQRDGITDYGGESGLPNAIPSGRNALLDAASLQKEYKNIINTTQIVHNFTTNGTILDKNVGNSKIDIVGFKTPKGNVMKLVKDNKPIPGYEVSGNDPFSKVSLFHQYILDVEESKKKKK